MLPIGTQIIETIIVVFGFGFAVMIVQFVTKTGAFSPESKSLMRTLERGAKQRREEQRRKTAHIRARVWIAVVVGIFVVATIGYAVGVIR
jgi:hypothetical protein